MDVEFTFDGYAVVVYVPEWDEDQDDYDDDDIIDAARGIMADKGLPFYVRDADHARVL